MPFDQLLHCHLPIPTWSRLSIADTCFYSFSYHSGQPPTPTKTPTSASFNQSFETPKLESSFYDPRVTWNTADPWAESPDLKTPKYLTFSTPLKSPNKASSTKRPLSGQDLEAQIASHVHHLSPNPDLSLPPVEPSRRLSSSPNPSSSTKRPCRRISEPELTPLKTSLDEELTSSIRSASSMQTPPPTSTSTSKRKAQQAQVIKLVQQSAASGRRMSSPHFQNLDPSTSQVEASPGFTGLQFSPEIFNFPNSGPATAPAFPQHKLFWDPEQNQDSMNLDFSNNDPFALGLEADKNLDPFVSSQDHATPSRLPSGLFHGLDGSQDDLAVFPVSAKAPAKKFPKSKTTANVVNPSMLFSSPSRSSDLSIIPPSSQVEVNSTLQPYAHQIQDAAREDEIRLSKKQKRRRGPEVDSPAVKAALQTLRDEDDDRTEIRRSVTDTVLESFNQPKTAKGLQRRKSRDLQRKSSPIREQTQRRLSTYKEAKQSSRRTSLTFTIDANGRAKTETKLVEDDAGPSSGSRMELDSITDSSDSSSSSEEDILVISQRQSINYGKPPKAKLTRFAADSRTHSQKSSYASTFASNSTHKTIKPTKSSRRRVISNLSLHYDDPSQLPLPMSDDRASSSTVISDRLDGRIDPDTEVETDVDSDEDNGDAQFELKKIMRHRDLSKAIHPQRSGSHKKHANEYPNPVYANQLQPYSFLTNRTPTHDPFNISPTTITDPDLATPNSAHDSQVSTDSTRCVCHGADSDGELMIMW